MGHCKLAYRASIGCTQFSFLDELLKTASNLEPIQEPDVITEIQPVIDALNQLLARLQKGSCC